MRLKKLGEFGLIERISRKIKKGRSVVKGIGDDAAVLEWKKDRYLLFASDMIIENVHFSLKRATPFGIGHKALAVNISDIAAMGGQPRYAVVSLGLPKRLSVKFIDGIYSGLRAIAERFNIVIVGGDTNSSRDLIIDVALMGEIEKDNLVLRSGAKIGDFVALTGALGGSAKKRHLSFIPRLEEARFLVRNFKINAMIDISDGLSGDLIKICRASRVGAKVYESLIPISKDAHSIKEALYDGEDFELLFTAPKDVFKGLIGNFKKRFSTHIAIIGEIEKRSSGIKMLNRYGAVVPMAEKGYRHF